MEHTKQELMIERQLVHTLKSEIEKLKLELSQSEAMRKKQEQLNKSLRDNRGKILRGLNTQTEIAIVQFKQDFEYMKKQLETKDQTIRTQDKKILKLTEDNLALRNGLEHIEMKNSDSEGEEVQPPLTNGHPNPRSIEAELAKFIKQLEL